MSCNKCTNPNCQLSLQKNGMFECLEENCDGTMVLDNTLAPRYKVKKKKKIQKKIKKKKKKKKKNSKKD